MTIGYYNPFPENWISRAERLFRDVHKTYPEYADKPIMDMIRLFAEDEFYHYHFLAKSYLVYCEYEWVKARSLQL